ncbi:MAG: B12-binding domain-containing radical SAM protein [Desulfuromusa sp.]|nr:B12-binding domain-containing radical SAM protein [Desulfuromusa sp.]
MKIALVNPKTDVFEMRMLYERHENIALGSIASNLESHGYSAEIFDLRVDDLSPCEIAKFIVTRNYQIVAFSINFATFPSAINICREIKFLNKDIVVIVGGEHVSYQDKKILGFYGHYIDFVIRGESEDTFVDLLKYLDNNNSNGCSVHGISYIDKRKNIFIRNDNRKPIENLDALPFANRTISKKAIKKGKSIEIGILAQRGCPFPCSFCNGNRFLSNEYPMIIRRRSPANVVDEMELLHQIIYKNRSFLRFYDATFITRDSKNRQWIETFCGEIERRNLKIPFDVFIRANSFNLNESNDISLISRLKSIGMISTYIGLESGSDSTLEKYNKKVDVNESKTMFNFFKSIGINGSTNGCMTFQQESTIIDIIKTVEFLYEIRLCSFWNCLTRAETLPGIKLNIINRKRETPWDVYNYSFCDKHVDKLYSILDQINKSFPSVRIEDRLIRLISGRTKSHFFAAGRDI